jgi:hypothetical protein
LTTAAGIGAAGGVGAWLAGWMVVMFVKVFSDLPFGIGTLESN